MRRGMVEQGLYEVSAFPSARPMATRASACSTRSPRTTPAPPRLLPGLVRLVEGNWANHVADVRLFEIGTTWSGGKPGDRAHEERRVAAVFTGHREPPHWMGTGQERFDLWDLKAGSRPRSLWRFPGRWCKLNGARGLPGTPRPHRRRSGSARRRRAALGRSAVRVRAAARPIAPPAAPVHPAACDPRRNGCSPCCCRGE